MFAPIIAFVPKMPIALGLWACGCSLALLKATPAAAQELGPNWRGRLNCFEMAQLCLKPHLLDTVAFMDACLAMAACSAVVLLFFVPGPFLCGFWIFLRGGGFCGHVCARWGDFRRSTPLPACGY